MADTAIQAGVLGRVEEGVHIGERGESLDCVEEAKNGECDFVLCLFWALFARVVILCYGPYP